MGKSSLRVHMMKQLKEQGIKCASVDLTRIGSHVTPVEWYGGFVSELLRGFGLSRKINFGDWWRSRELLAPKQRLSEFIDDVLLTEFSEKIIIFIDEIDSILAINFKDDFFAFIRACYNQRVDNPEYQRLSFCLLGVATPPDLIADKSRTPFNIGRAIALTGFKLDEVEVLVRGLEGVVANPQVVIEEVLKWTGGQPFLTQKLCQLICLSPDLFPGEGEAKWVERLVQTQIIRNWETQDEPEHLRTIRDRLTRVSENQAGKLLGLYQQILQTGGIPATDSPEQTQLRLTGLVVKLEDHLQVYNPIYAEVFNLAWVEEALANIRPYNQALNDWVSSNFEDESRLLRGQALQDARNWSLDKSLSDLDRRFLDASQESEKQDIQRKLQAEAEATQILSQANQVLLVANQKAKRRIQIGGGVLAIALIATAIAGVWIKNTLQEVQREKIKSLTISAKALLNSNQEIDGLVAILKAAVKLKSLNNLDINTQELVRLELQRAVYQIREKNRLEGHHGAVRSVKFSPDGQAIATASEDGTVRIWNIDGQEIKKLGEKNQVFRDVDFSPNGKIIAAIDKQNNIKIWDRNGQELITLKGENQKEAFISSVSFSPDSQMIAAPHNDNKVKIWQINGRVISNFKGHDDAIWNIVFSPDGKKILTTDVEGHLSIWNINGQLLKTFKASEKSIFGISFSPDGQAIATALGDTNIKLWSLEGKEIKTLGKHENYATSVSFSPDGQTIVSTSADNTVKLWSINAREGRELRTFRGHQNSVFSASFSPNGKIIASASADNTVKIWNIDSLEAKILSGHSDSLWSVDFSPDGQTIASAGDDGTIKIWNLQGQEIASIDNLTNENWNRIWTVRFSPDGQTIATANYDRTVKIWNLKGQILKNIKAHNNPVIDLEFSHDGKILVTGSYDGTIKLWDINGKEIKKLPGNAGEVWSISLHPNSQIIASAHNDGTIKFWNLQGENFQSFSAHNNLVKKITFSPDGKMIASTSQDKAIKLWNLDGKEIRTLKTDTAQVTQFSFSPDSQILASTYNDGTIRLWQVRDGREIKTAEGNNYPLWNLAFSPDGKTIASVSDDALVTLWKVENLNSQQLIIRGCQWLDNYLQNSPSISETDKQICN